MVANNVANNLNFPYSIGGAINGSITGNTATVATSNQAGYCYEIVSGSNTSVSGNSCTGNMTYTAMPMILNTMVDSSATGNTLVNTSSATNATGLQVLSGSGNTVSGNAISVALGYGIRVSANSTTVAANSIDGNGTTPYGILLDNGYTGHNIVNNTITNVTTGAISGTPDATTFICGNSNYICQMPSAFALNGTLTPTALAADQNDYNPTGLSGASALRIDGGASDRNITGLQGGVDGRVITIINIGASNSLILKADNASSSAANRFTAPYDVTITLKSASTLRYDGTTQRWRPWDNIPYSAVPLTRTLTTTAPLTCDGGASCDLTTNRTLAITGQVALANGGTNANLTASNGGIPWSDASKLNILAGTATARLPLISGATATPAWAAFSLPASVTSGGIPYFSSTSAMSSSALLTQNGVIYGGGAGGSPASTAAGINGQLFLGVTSGAPQWGTMSQDCTITNAGVVTCLKSNNVAFGTAAFQNTGTSGANIPFLNGTNTWSGAQTISASGTAALNLSGGAATITGDATALIYSAATNISVVRLTGNATSYYNDFGTGGTGTSIWYFRGTSAFTAAFTLFSSNTAGNVAINASTGAGTLYVNGSSNFNTTANSGTAFTANGTSYFTGGGIYFTSLSMSTTAPTISSGCGGGSPSISTSNGTSAFKVTIGTASGSTCVINMPTAANGWNCYANDLTTHTTANAFVMQTATATNQITLTGYSDIMGAATWVASDVIAVHCMAL